MKTWTAVVAAAAFLGFQGLASADEVAIEGSAGLNGLGFFTGTFEYTPTSLTTGIVEVSLTNTSPIANGGYITAFVFNLPGGATVTTAIFSATDADFKLLGAPTFSGGVNGAPFGQFDLGSSTFKHFEGGGAPSKGIAVGDSVDFTFSLTGTGLGSLTTMDFLEALSTGVGAGEGYESLVVRFRGFCNDGSDKVPARAVPEPGTIALLGLGVLGLLARKRRSAL